MDLLCINDCGQSSLHCHNTRCNLSNQKHRFCRVIKLRGLTELLEKHFNFYRIFLERIQQIEQDLIARIRKEREQTFNRILFREFEDEQIIVLEEVFIKKNIKSIRGTHIQNVYQKLILQNNRTERNYEQMKEFQNQFARLQLQIGQLRQKLEKQRLQSELLTASKILTNQQNQQGKFILDCLNYPKEINLLYRASQNEFSASKFHQVCDGVANLLVLIKTEFGKIIGGFNSIGWKSQLHGQYSADYQGKSFLFSVDLRQKMDLIKYQNALVNHQQYGPLFGRDLQLTDKCNQNKTNYSKFPFAYNFISEPYTQNQQTYRMFTGSETVHFGVSDYEVFSVIK